MNLIDRAKNILLTPKVEWEKIAFETETMQNVLVKYVVPLAAIAAICTFIGYSFIGNGMFVASVGFGLRMAIVSFITSVLGVVITSYVVDALAPSFNSQKNIHKSTQLVAYGYTPAFVGAFLNIVPTIGAIGGLLGLYGIYLIYLGLGPIKKTPEDKKAVYMIVTFVVLIVVYLVLGALLGRFLISSYATPVVV